ncbi:MAG: T9SS type A sorting domain-containing protein [Bacteroidia bacterium]|nr:T9SS type A sorting domain-containing protein [Bacteroidia bacterium]
MHWTPGYIIICTCTIFSMTAINLDGQQSTIQWLGDSTSYLPSDIELVVSNCDNGFMFPLGYFEDIAGPDSWPDFPLVEGVHFNSDCSNAVFEVINGPDYIFPEGLTTVTYLVTNECDDTLSHEFVINLVCSNCLGGGIFCSSCSNTIENGCFTCNVDELLDGFLSCTPEYLGPNTQDDQPNPLCNGNGVPNNMSWFAFVAGSTELCITVSPFQCATGSGGIGLQSGVYDFCSEAGGKCIGGDAFCSSGLDPIEYTLEDLIAGNTYYLFVDGCNGAECDYEITIDKGFSFELDTPDSISYSAIPKVDTTGLQNIVYSNTKIQFDINHKGDAESDSGEFDDPGPYSPDLDAEFHWTFNPPINGIDTAHWNPARDGYNIPLLIIEDVMDSTRYQVCLTDIVNSCDTVKCDNCCFDFIVVPQTTSISSIGQSIVSIYPNPGTGIFYIENNPFKRFKVLVYDNRLRQVRTQVNSSEIDLTGDMTEGIFYIIIEDYDSDRIISHRIVKY